MNVTHYSDEFIHDIEKFNSNNNVLEDLNKYYPVFLSIEKLDYFPTLNIYLINTED